MTVLVLGGSGFIGRHLLRRLAAAGDVVIATSRNPAGQPEMTNLHWCKLDLADFDDWRSLLTDVSQVYHLAWSTIPATAESDPVGDMTVNVGGSVRLLEALKDRPGIRLVFVSSGGMVYGRPVRVPVLETDPAEPIGIHGISKLEVEHYIAHHAAHFDLDAVVLRVANAYGQGQYSGRPFGAVSTFCHLAKAREPLKIFGDGTVVRDYVHVDDIVDALLSVAVTHSGQRVFNIGSGIGHSLNDVVAIIERMCGYKLSKKHLARRIFDVPISILDPTKALLELGWRARISIEDGVARMLASES